MNRRMRKGNAFAGLAQTAADNGTVNERQDSGLAEQPNSGTEKYSGHSAGDLAGSSRRGLGGAADQTAAHAAGSVPAGELSIQSRNGAARDAAYLGDAPRSRHFARLLLLVLLAVCALALRSRGGAPEWLLFTVVSAVTAWCWIVPYAFVGRISAERVILTEGRPVDGGRLRVRLTIRTGAPLPMLWLTVRDEISNETSGGERPLVYRSFGLPMFGRTHTIEYDVKGLHRGSHKFHRVHVSIGDMLGLTVRSFTLPCFSGVLVGPSPPLGGRVCRLPETVPGSTQDSDRRRRSALLGAPAQQINAERQRPGAGPDLRAYVPGDPLRRIDWRAVARGIGMQTRIGDSEPPGEAFVLLDASASAYGEDPRLFDACAGYAAAAVKEAFGRGSNVTLLCGGRERTRLHIRAGDKAGCRKAIDILARLKAEDDRALSGWMAETASRLPRGASFVCLTGQGKPAASRNAAGAWEAELARSARIAKHRCVSLDLRILCGESDAAESLRRWTGRMRGTGSAVAVLPVPESYRSYPVISEGGERNG